MQELGDLNAASVGLGAALAHKVPLHHLHKPLAQWVCAAAVRSARHLRKSVQKREGGEGLGLEGHRWVEVGQRG